MFTSLSAKPSLLTTTNLSHGGGFSCYYKSDGVDGGHEIATVKNTETALTAL